MFKFGGVVDDYDSDKDADIVLEPFELAPREQKRVAEYFDLTSDKAEVRQDFPKKGIDIIETRSVIETVGSELAAVFPFERFNCMQTRCLDAVFGSDINVVVGAPTASGKTVVFELAICRLIAKGDKDAKVVYISPYKALCQQVFRDWKKKFQKFSLSCVELTGDSDLAAFPDLRKYSIMFVSGFFLNILFCY